MVNQRQLEAGSGFKSFTTGYTGSHREATGLEASSESAIPGILTYKILSY